MNYTTKFHRDGSITYWDVFFQGWVRVSALSVSDRALATLSDGDRSRTASHAARAASHI
jgi:hypothetical protein